MENRGTNFDFDSDDEVYIDTSMLPLSDYNILDLGLPEGIIIYRHPSLPSIRVYFSNQILTDFPPIEITDYTSDPLIIFVSF